MITEVMDQIGEEESSIITDLLNVEEYKINASEFSNPFYIETTMRKKLKGKKLLGRDYHLLTMSNGSFCVRLRDEVRKWACLKMLKYDHHPSYLPKALPCHGLLLLGESTNLVVLKPMSKSSLALPPLLGEVPDMETFGLGYDFTNKRYKVVRICKIGHNVSASILTVGDDSSWRDLEGVPYIGGFLGMPVFSAGEIYWLRAVTETVTVILCIDLSSELFLSIDFLVDPNATSPTLLDLHGSLNLVLKIPNNKLEFHQVIPNQFTVLNKFGGHSTRTYETETDHIEEIGNQLTWNELFGGSRACLLFRGSRGADEEKVSLEYNLMTREVKVIEFEWGMLWDIDGYKLEEFAPSLVSPLSASG